MRNFEVVCTFVCTTQLFVQVSHTRCVFDDAAGVYVVTNELSFVALSRREKTREEMMLELEEPAQQRGVQLIQIYELGWCLPLKTRSKEKARAFQLRSFNGVIHARGSQKYLKSRSFSSAFIQPRYYMNELKGSKPKL